MKRPVTSCLVIFVVLIMWLPSTWAKNPDSLSLIYHAFQIPDEPEPIIEKGHPIKHTKKRAKHVEQAEKTVAVSKLQDLVLKNFGGAQDGYIQLSDSEFIVFVSNTGRIGLGLYLVDLSTNTISRDPIAHGEVTIQSALKDKVGNDFLLLHHIYPMHAGIGGESYSLLSARKSIGRKAIVSLVILGDSEFNSEENRDGCAVDPKRIIHENVTVSVEDLNKDGHLDISVTQNQFNCATKLNSTQQTNYVAGSNGFASIENDPVTKLLKAEKKAIDAYKKKGPTAGAKILEDAGIMQIFYEKPTLMQEDAYVSILNNYAFFIGSYGKALQAEDILNRVILISPRRAVAYLNRAEVLYEMLLLGELKTQHEKTNAAKKIMKDYETYKNITGKPVEWLERFSAFNLASYPMNTNVCDYIKRYYDEHDSKSRLPRMNEIILESKRIDINNDGIEDDVEFKPGKFGYKTYDSISINGENGNKIEFTGSVSRKPTTGYGFQIFSFQGRIYKLLPMNDVSYIDHDKEKLVCEAEWGEIPVGGGWRPLKTVRLIN